MIESVLLGKPSPYCPGCGHALVTHAMARALEEVGTSPLDVVIVSDIGCCGLVDGLVRCHTVHGLHGRAVALAMGVRLGLEDPAKKVIAIQGDGGATIGIQHLLEAARHNIDLTLIVQNNMLYGMTGGQMSGLSPAEMRAERMAGSVLPRPYDICELAHRAGASFCARVFAGSDSVDAWTEALRTPGFSLVEIVEMCPSYGVKKVKDLYDVAEYDEVVLRSRRDPASLERREKPSLFASLPPIGPRFDSPVSEPIGIVIAGSAGEGIQSAGELLASAGVAAGLHTTKKGEYPITVGTGFSVAEVILSPDEVRYTGIESPHVVVVTSEDGWDKVKGRLRESTRLVVDSHVELDDGSIDAARVLRGDFRKRAGRRGAAVAAIAAWLKESGALPVDALKAVASTRKRGQEIVEAIESAL